MEVINPEIDAMRRHAAADPEGFWATAGRKLPWRKPWEAVFAWDPDRPDERGRYFRWYVGGFTNLSWNAVDRHVQRGRGGVAALVCEDERGGREVVTYAQLQHRVRRAAAALRGLGISRGDRVAIYMPTCAEAIILMLACARVGAIHLMVFAGFGAGALRDRVTMAGARVVFCADTTYRKGRDVPLKGIVDAALEGVGCVERVVVLARRGGEPAGGGDLSWNQFLALAHGQSDEVEGLESNEPAYILATSGTTAKPKLAVHTHGGHQVFIHAMGDWVFGLSENDVWWSTSDLGWVVGHSYIVYAPLLAGAAARSCAGC